MKASEIFKMEIWKNCRDVPYLTLAAVIGGIGWLLSIVNLILSKASENSHTPAISQGIVIVTILGVLTFLGYLVVAFLYPLHLLSTDYRNRVLNLMVASGVKRIHLYFAKIGATILSTVVIMFVMASVPVATFLLGKTGIIYYLFKEFNMDSETILYLLMFVFMYLATLVTLCFSVILLKGNYLSILVTWAIQQVCGIVAAPIFMLVMQSADASQNPNASANAMVLISIVLYIVEILIFGCLSAYLMNRQNL
ncbi:hypothetical protein SAMN02745116_01107 [Pilibacter termitis]|uniref:ABC-2 family transporter protein n=1 Tax=Pilibacter termitis TaxID=263852 RepID=A0A1T4MI56_9ENTE|nr:hypothetical protein [Pilibacter termitis]SJZ66770.1 hypothetical protein SAMN02745116_01107 [Pilibacter termitis]